ncbi:hypothetical protein HOLleu_40306 [Holothuria leucospilota]|uniref:Uncharacterized protein n=1 Tax=Holothuria leucospilota TaxID=206669 RepID=A0A9Q0YKV2_HOLLE|nr:hypothetical protein HOLleu_40306 [Holothuria leucospilota]
MWGHFFGRSAIICGPILYTERHHQLARIVCHEKLKLFCQNSPQIAGINTLQAL